MSTQSSKLQMSTTIRRKHNYYEYNGDGQFDRDRLTKQDKRKEQYNLKKILDTEENLQLGDLNDLD